MLSILRDDLHTRNFTVYYQFFFQVGKFYGMRFVDHWPAGKDTSQEHLRAEPDCISKCFSFLFAMEFSLFVFFLLALF